MFTKIIIERDPKFTSALCKNLHQLFSAKLSLSTAHRSQNDVLAKRMIQNLEDMVIRSCAYGLEIKDWDAFSYDWLNLLPALELAYKTSIDVRTNQITAIVERGWNPRLPQDFLRKDLVEIDTTADS
ncbi:hypothetical protein O181_096970 [Austropuccinia psidii MF-1]|uniref:Uncharacterized protein n=1 Tax=Austropuccinia psidii MF-1 TaxID=1389203 RepID=A0A9Q3PDH6_9BASI|nr:hypothetical protein [Austropuccinia psidii MF-1]